MFLANSRYTHIESVTVRTADGRTIDALKLRRLPAPKAAPHAVTDADRLDTMAERRYGEPTWFWHIADANSELEAGALVRDPKRTIQVPET